MVLTTRLFIGGRLSAGREKASVPIGKKRVEEERTREEALAPGDSLVSPAGYAGMPFPQAGSRSMASPRSRNTEGNSVHTSSMPRVIGDALVFVTPDGLPIRRANFRNRIWLKAVADSVGSPMRLHDLRHSHAAYLIANGEQPKTIQMRLGHSFDFGDSGPVRTLVARHGRGGSRET